MAAPEHGAPSTRLKLVVHPNDQGPPDSDLGRQQPQHFAISAEGVDRKAQVSHGRVSAGRELGGQTADCEEKIADYASIANERT